MYINRDILLGYRQVINGNRGIKNSYTKLKNRKIICSGVRCVLVLGCYSGLLLGARNTYLNTPPWVKRGVKRMKTQRQREETIRDKWFGEQISQLIFTTVESDLERFSCDLVLYKVKVNIHVLGPRMIYRIRCQVCGS